MVKSETLFILVFLVSAMLRVLVFCAAFPFFNNTDEHYHFDTVVKYSNGYLPRKDLNLFDLESAKLIVVYASPEYLNKPEDFSSGKIPRPRWLNVDVQAMATYVEHLSTVNNYEAFSPPVYYMVAGMWYKIG